MDIQHTLTWTCAALLAATGVATAGDPGLVLHAVEADPGRSCSSSEIAGFDCDQPTETRVETGESVDIAVYLREASGIVGIQCRFDWPTDWSLQYWRGNCRTNQLELLSPAREAPDLAAVFDVITDARASLLGWMSFVAGSGGCVTVAESPYPGGTHIIDLSGDASPLLSDTRGSVCSGASGIDGCSFGPILNLSSWGQIKSQYQN